MKDRVSTYPGRVRLIPVDGQPNVYDLERADEPSQLGTELKRDTLLSDATAALLGLTDAATPNDAFARVKTLIGDLDGEIVKIRTGSYTGAGVYGEDAPNSLTFDKTPYLVVITGPGDKWPWLILQRGVSQLRLTYAVAGSSSRRIAVTWTDNGVSWYNYDSGSLTGGAEQQFNVSGDTYYYTAICQ